MKIYTRQFNSELGQMIQVETEMDIVYRSAVATIADLPSSENIELDARVCLDTDHLHVYLNGSWVDQGVLDMGDLMQDRLMQGLS
jgi:hypothetical protein